MRQVILSLATGALVFGSGLAQAEGNLISIGSKSLTIAYDDSSSSTDDELGGFELSYTRGIGEIAGARVAYYSMTHKDNSDLTASGLDLKFMLGKNIAQEGFKFFGGIGYFDETWDWGDIDYSEDFSGLEYFGGLGYNASQLAIDFILEARDATDYEDFVNSTYGTDLSAAAISGTLSLGYRF